MSIDQIIRAWKADDDDDQEEQDENAPENPAGEQELSDEDLEQAAGGTTEETQWSHNACPDNY